MSHPPRRLLSRSTLPFPGLSRAPAKPLRQTMTLQLTFKADTNSETSNNVNPEMESTMVASFGDNGCSGVDGCSSRATRDA